MLNPDRNHVKQKQRLSFIEQDCLTWIEIIIE